MSTSIFIILVKGGTEEREGYGDRDPYTAEIPNLKGRDVKRPFLFLAEFYRDSDLKGPRTTVRPGPKWVGSYISSCFS